VIWHQGAEVGGAVPNRAAINPRPRPFDIQLFSCDDGGEETSMLKPAAAEYRRATQIGVDEARRLGVRVPKCVR
jgi:hypothetical protein